MLRSEDESLIRKCMRLYILISNSGVSLNTAISQSEFLTFSNEKKSLLSQKGEKLLQKLQSAISKPSMSKKQLATNEDILNWEEINKIRKATKGCLTILKEKINSQFEKKKEFDLSFGLSDQAATPTVVVHDLSAKDINTTNNNNKLTEYKNELDKNTNVFAKKREETYRDQSRFVPAEDSSLRCALVRSQ